MSISTDISGNQHVVVSMRSKCRRSGNQFTPWANGERQEPQAQSGSTGGAASRHDGPGQDTGGIETRSDGRARCLLVLAQSDGIAECRSAAILEGLVASGLCGFESRPRHPRLASVKPDGATLRRYRPPQWRGVRRGTRKALNNRGASGPEHRQAAWGCRGVGVSGPRHPVSGGAGRVRPGAGRSSPAYAGAARSASSRLARCRSCPGPRPSRRSAAGCDSACWPWRPSGDRAGPARRPRSAPAGSPRSHAACPEPPGTAQSTGPSAGKCRARPATYSRQPVCAATRRPGWARRCTRAAGRGARRPGCGYVRALGLGASGQIRTRNSVTVMVWSSAVARRSASASAPIAGG